MTEKNYTDEMTAELLTAYEPEDTESERDNTVEKFAVQFGKSTRSIRAKLASEGVYVAKVKAVKEKGVTKETLVNSIAGKLELDFEDVESLKSATKKTLILVWNAIVLFYDEVEPEVEAETE